MANSEMNSAGRAVIYLAACALHGKLPDREAIEKMDIVAVYEQASRHSMIAITYISIAAYVKEYGDGLIDSQLLEDWKKRHDAVFRKLVLMSFERERLTEFFESNGIWYMPLKGIILMDYYPRLGMRQMSDNDILVDPSKRREIYEFMTGNGYKVVYYDCEHPDTYSKDGKFLFEIHHSLYADIESKRKIYNYYKDVSGRLLSSEDGSFKRRFSDDDFYIYHLTHAYKHFTSSGNGIRSLMDMYIVSERLEGKLDRRYVSSELNSLEISRYEEIVKSLSNKLFSKSPPTPDEYDSILDEDELEILDYHIVAGVFGTMELHARNKIHGFEQNQKVTFWSKIKYIFRRVFPNLDYYKLTYPKAYKNKILIPFFWLYRIVKGLKKIKKHIKETKTVLSLKSESREFPK